MEQRSRHARRPLAALLAVVIALASPGAAARAADGAPALAITYLANEGFLVEGGGDRVLVDALFGGGITGYPTLAVPVREALERGEGKWGEVSVAIASHFHGDHFDAGAVSRFLRANPRAHFVSTPQAVAKLPAGDAGFGDRVHAVLPEPGAVAELALGGVRIEVFNLHHGPRRPPVENIGVVVELGGQRFLHFGDTEAKMDDFRPYLDRLRGVDVALLPFWFLASEWRIELVRNELRPRCVVAAHLPTPQAPASYFARWQSHAELLRTIRDAFPQARIPSADGPEPVSCTTVPSP